MDSQTKSTLLDITIGASSVVILGTGLHFLYTMYYSTPKDSGVYSSSLGSFLGEDVGDPTPINTSSEDPQNVGGRKRRKTIRRKHRKGTKKTKTK
jgi:hypothetical protein